MNKHKLSQMPVIGKILAYKLKIVDNVIMIDEEQDPDVMDVIEIIQDSNGRNIYLTNKWNETFDDIQCVHEIHVKEYISN